MAKSFKNFICFFLFFLLLLLPQTSLKSQLISHEANMKRLQEELTLCQQSKEKKEHEIDEMKSEMNSYHKTLEVRMNQILKQCYNKVVNAVE